MFRSTLLFPETLKIPFVNTSAWYDQCRFLSFLIFILETCVDIIELLKLESIILMSPSHLYAPVVKVLYEGPLHLGNANTEVRVSKLQPVAAAHLFLDKRQAWCNKHFEVSKQLASNFSTTTFGLIELLSAANKPLCIFVSRYHLFCKWIVQIASKFQIMSKHINQSRSKLCPLQ